jgi:hypothetical protein
MRNLRNIIINKVANERGGSILEFTFVAAVFFMMLVGIVAAGNLYYTHNALVEATRRGTRYAVMHPNGSAAAVRDVVVYGTDNPPVGATSLIYNLVPGNVTVTYPGTGINVGSGTVTVSITGYSFPFVLPTRTTSIAMPPYSTTLTGECAGFIPPNL